MNIVMLDGATLGKNSIESLRELGQFRCYDLTQGDEVINRAQEAEVIITNKVVITDAHMQALPKLKLICVAATGTNNIDLAAAKKHGITVCNVAGYSTSSVVQHTFSLMTSIIANSHKYIHDCANEAWLRSPMFCRLDYDIEELAGKTLAIVGYGELGQNVEKVAHAFGMNVIIAERRGASEVRQGRVSLEDALKQADIVTLHCPLTDSTQDLINKDTLAMMKPTAVLINTARGPVINEQDLADALASKAIAGAALDVLSKEPACDSSPLARYKGDNLILTPHIAWASSQARDRLIAQLGENIRSFARGEIRNQVG